MPRLLLNSQWEAARQSIRTSPSVPHPPQVPHRQARRLPVAVDRLGPLLPVPCNHLHPAGALACCRCFCCMPLPHWPLLLMWLRFCAPSRPCATASSATCLSSAWQQHCWHAQHWVLGLTMYCRSAPWWAACLAPSPRCDVRNLALARAALLWRAGRHASHSMRMVAMSCAYRALAISSLLRGFSSRPALIPCRCPCPALPQVLNVGLLIGALFHILELGSLLVDGGIQVSGFIRMESSPSLPFTS